MNFSNLFQSQKAIAARFARRFARDERGTFATVLGVSAMAVCLTAGIAVDYTRIVHTKSAIEDALDAAILAAGNDLSKGSISDAALRQSFDDFFFANLENRQLQAEGVEIVRFEADQDTGKISADVKADLKMAFMGLAGIPSVDVGAKSEVTFSATSVELAMMLDVTGSMNERNKIGSLKVAAADAINILLPQQSQDNKMRISIVPYSASVNAGAFAPAVSKNTRIPFVTERWGGEKFSDANPSGGKMEAQSGYGPSQSVVPLSNDPAPLLSTISAFTGSGATAGHLGVAWSYYTLSPKWKNVWPARSTPTAYKERNVQKVALLMTDGEFNTIYPPRGSRWSSSEFAVELCQSMKRDGITIYAVGFEAPASAEATLRACASPSQNGNNYYFSAQNGAELKSAFQKIAFDIQQLRLSK